LPSLVADGTRLVARELHAQAGDGRGDVTGSVELAAAPRALRIGLCHEFQLVDRLPPRPGDEAVDLVLTPRERVLTGARPLPLQEVLS